MILYELTCSRDHGFSAWFAGSEAYERQRAAELVTCPICDDTDVTKAPMAPRIGHKAPAPLAAASAAPAEAVSTHATGEIARMIGEFCRAIESNCDYVGDAFPEEARKIHYGESDPRGIYGEATAEDAAILKEEGIEIAAVPWIRKADA